MSNALDLLREEVKEYTTSALIKLISQITWKGPNVCGFHGSSADQLRYRQFELNLISKYSILYSDESTNKKSIATPDDIGKLLDLLHDHFLEPQFETDKHSEGKLSRKTIYSFLRRMSQLQFRFVRDFHLELGRTLTIYNDLLKLGRRRKNYSEAFDQIYGMNFERFAQICYLIFAGYMSGRRSIVDIVRFCRTLPGFLDREFERAFKLLSTDKKGFEKLTIRRTIKDPLFEYYDFNPLQSHPIYLLNNNEFIIPSYYEFVFRMTDGVYFDLFNKYSDKDNIKSNPFSEDLGEVFEEYVETLWGITGKTWKKEFAYSGGEKKFSDYSVLEDDRLFLIELKAKRLRLPTRISGKNEDLVDDLESGVIEGLIQIHKKIDDVKKCVKGIEEFHGAKKFYGIILTMDKMYLGNSQAFREVVDNILYARGIMLEFEYQIMEVNEFEDLIEPFRRGMNWTMLMERKLQSDMKENPFMTMRNITPLYSKSKNQFLAQRFESFNQAIINALSKIETPEKSSVLHLPPFTWK